MVLAAAPLAAQPVGPSLVAGQAQVSSFGATTFVNQSTNKAIINWQDFSVPAGSAVQFNQPSASAITLNRVTGAGISNIDGSIRANGQVWLLNPNGLMFGGGAIINVGGLLAATSDIANRDFEDGLYNFAGGRGSIVNNGVIKASNGGSVILSAPSVTNRGLIQVSAGHVVLGGTDTFTVDFNGDHLLSYAVGANSTGGSVTNTGKISATGGRVLLTARAASGVRDAVINNAGMLEATSVREEGGEIILEAEGGSVSSSGTIDVSGKGAGEVGGTVKVLGNIVAIEDGANIDASGQVGGGTILIGGNAGGKGLEINALSARVGNSAINASAIATGNGGKVVVYSTGNTTVSGSITAKGGAVSGNGGMIETSGHFLNLSGVSVDAGLGGDWLLDPYDLSVGSTAAASINNTLGAGTNVTLETSASGATGAGSQNASGYGDINIDAPIAWSTAAHLNISAYRDINFNAPITINGPGIINISTGMGSPGDYKFNNGANINFGSIDNGAGLTINGQDFSICYDARSCTDQNLNLSGNYALGTSLDATGVDAPYPIGLENNGYPLLLDYNLNQTNYIGFSGIFEGLGNTISNLSLSHAGGLFGYSSGIIRDVGLLNVSGLFSQSTGSELSQGGYTLPPSFGGLVNYNYGKIINSNVTGVITGGISIAGGLVGWNGGLIKDSFSNTVNSSNSLILGVAGGLVGVNWQGGEIQSSFADGIINLGYGYAGGLVGYNRGSIESSHSAGITNTSSYSETGGLVGYNEGGIEKSYASGVINSSDYSSYIGGLVGVNQNPATITNSYSASSINVLGGGVIGGLVGANYGYIENSSSYSELKQTGASAYIGGLVGINYGLINSSSSTGLISIDNPDSEIGYYDSAAGGLVGVNGYGGSITDSYSFTSTSIRGGVGTYAIGGLVGQNEGSIEKSYSAGTIISEAPGNIGGSNIGGSVGFNESGATVTSTFWDVDTSGLATDGVNGGATGLHTSALQGGVPSEFNPRDGSNDVWGSGPNIYPYILSQGSPIVISGTVYSDAAGNKLQSNLSNGIIEISSLVNGQKTSNATVGANGYYYMIEPSQAFSGSDQLLVYVNNEVSQSGVLANAYFQNFVGDRTVADLTNKQASVISPATSLSSIYGGLSVALGAVSGSDFFFQPTQESDIQSQPRSQLTFNGGAGGATFKILSTAASGINIDTPLISPGAALLIDAAGRVTQSARIEAATVGIRTPGDIVIMSGATISAGSGAAAGATDIIMSGATISAGSGAAAGATDIILRAGGSFINNSGLGAATFNIANGGSFSIFSQGPAGDTFGGLNSNNQAIWNTNYLTPIEDLSSSNSTGSRYVFAFQPTVTVSISNATKTYGVENSSSIAGSYTISGLQTGVSGAYLSDSASNIQRGSVVSLGSSANANVGTYVLNLVGSSAPSGYSLSVRSGVLTVNPATLTYVANSATKIYGSGNPQFSGDVVGFVNNDTRSSSVSGALSFSSIAADASPVGKYSVNGSGLSATNYVFTQAAGNSSALTVSPATLTYVANAVSRLYSVDNPVFTGDVIGFVNGDTLSTSVSGVLSFSSSAEASSPVGNYAVNGSGLSAINYLFTQSDGNASALTVTAPPPVVISNIVSAVQASVRGALSTPTVSASFASLPVPSLPAPSGAVEISPASSSPAASASDAASPAGSATATNQKSAPISAPIPVALISSSSANASAPQAASPLAANNAEAPISSDRASASLASSLGDGGAVKSESGNGSKSDSKSDGETNSKEVENQSGATGKSSTSTASGGRRGVATVLIPGFLTVAPPPPLPPLDPTSLPAFGNLALWQ